MKKKMKAKNILSILFFASFVLSDVIELWPYSDYSKTFYSKIKFP